ncbi:MAG: hypothetical protein IPH40_06850 [Polaromonas sp.]|nr:hypothetical protein [Polaromonas sp.]
MARAMRLSGLADRQIEAVSFGKENLLLWVPTMLRWPRIAALKSITDSFDFLISEEVTMNLSMWSRPVSLLALTLSLTTAQAGILMMTEARKAILDLRQQFVTMTD